MLRIDLKMKRAIVAPLILVASLALIVASCGDDPGRRDDAALEVVTTTTVLTDFAQTSRT
jgi:hypothetical protein